MLEAGFVPTDGGETQAETARCVVIPNHRNGGFARG